MEPVPGDPNVLEKWSSREAGVVMKEEEEGQRPGMPTACSVWCDVGTDW